jgi:hypothetical protein
MQHCPNPIIERVDDLDVAFWNLLIGLAILKVVMKYDCSSLQW